MPREITAALVSLAAVFTVAGVFFRPAAAKQAGQAPPLPSSGSPGQVRGVGRQRRETPTVRVLLTDGTVETLALEDYVQRVVTAEMPASFESAALEAQAVCARTYALQQAQAGKHAAQEADVCADPGCCQAYAAHPPESWGADAPALSEKLRAATQATAGQVLRMDGQLISAVFHASSQGATAPAQAVWGSAVPYLVSVSTPETPETVPRLESQVAFSPEEFRELFLAKYPQADLSGPPNTWFDALERGDWGGVTKLGVGGVTLSGGEARSLFGLRSTRFTVTAGEEAVTFQVTGYGHGVGMSQHGANLMAKDGADCATILAHYYPGTELGSI